MAKKRMSHTAAFKAKVAFAAVKGESTLSELAAKFGVSASVIARWKARLIDGAEELFEDGRKKKDDAQVDTEALFTKIGKMEVMMETMKKKSGMFP